VLTKLLTCEKHTRRKALAAYFPLAHSYGLLAAFVNVSTRLKKYNFSHSLELQ